MRIRDSFLNFIRGVIIGIANIIPGISGGTLAVSLGLYESIIKTIATFFKNIKKNILFLLPILLGMLAGILSSSKLLSFCLGNYQVQTMLFFIGLIIGGTKLLGRKVKKKIDTKNIIIFLVIFILMIALHYLLPQQTKEIAFENLTVISYLKLMLVGIISAGAMIIPGISGSLILMLMGYYKPIIDTLSSLANVNLLPKNLLIILSFGIGTLIGIILLAKLIKYLLEKHETKTYFGIMAFVLSSVVILILNLHPVKVSLLSIISYVVFPGWGYLLAINIEKE